MQTAGRNFLLAFHFAAAVAFWLALWLFSGIAISKPIQNEQNGKAIFTKNNCLSCHSIADSGGCLAPPLDGIAQRRGRDFIISRICNSADQISRFSKVYKATELMPHPRLEQSEAKAVAGYLMSIPAKQLKVAKHQPAAVLGAEPSTHKPSEASVLQGKKLFYSKGCMVCHSVFGTGGQFAVALDGIQDRKDRNFVLARINNAELMQLGVGGEYQEKGTNMPPSNLTPDEIASITDFLMSLPARN